jgi:dipeptidyl aminopeptidase/acylaminoacyl peptidase
MLRTFPTPIFSRLASAVRHLLLPALVLTAACDNPTEPIRSHPRPSFALTAPLAKGQILFTVSANPNNLSVVDPATTNVVQLTSGPDDHSVGAWSADYTKITFSKGLFDGLWMMDADGTNETQLLAVPQQVRSSVFSPDGKYIAFIANVPADAQVHTVELATGQVKQLTNLTGIGLRISWSADGKKLLFSRQVGTSYNLFSIAPDGTGMKQLTKCKVVCWDGQYSPDGTQIAFIYGGQVATMAANGGKITTVTSAADPQPHYPSWSPKGDQLAYERQLGPQHDIWVVSLVNGATTPVVTNRVDDTTPSWSR